MAPQLPTILSFLATTATLATQLATMPDEPDPLPFPKSEDLVDPEMQDAARRKGRQILAGSEQTIVTGQPVGAELQPGSPLLVGS